MQTNISSLRVYFNIVMVILRYFIEEKYNHTFMPLIRCCIQYILFNYYKKKINILRFTNRWRYTM